MRAEGSRWIRESNDFGVPEQAEPMATERKAFAAANLANQYVIVSAGLSNEAQSAVALSSVERYDVSSNSW